MPDANVPDITEKEIPIYKTWAYERILRMNMVKQADVLLLPLWYSNEWSDEDKRANYEYYEPRTIHESSFSPSIHQILAAELGKEEQAYEFFKYMARLDLDDYNKNTAQGLHMTPKAGTWMCMTYGFAGMRTDEEVLKFSPTIPKQWDEYSFRIKKDGSVIEVKVNKDYAEFKTIEGADVGIFVYNKKYSINSDGIRVKTA